MPFQLFKTVFLLLSFAVTSTASFAQTQSGDSLAVPENISPAVGVTIAAGSRVTFSWEAQAGVGLYDFHLFDRTDGDLTFTLDLNASAICSQSVCSISQVVNLPIETRHAWRVRAKNGGVITGWSRSEFNVGQVAFTPPAAPVVPEPPAIPSSPIVAQVPTNVSPVSGASIQPGSTVSFTWQAQDGVPVYDFHLFDKTDGTLTFTRDILAADVCSGTRCTLEQRISLPVLSGHAWRVRAKTTVNISGWSRSILNVGTGSTIEPEPGNPQPPVNPTPPTGPVLPVTPINVTPAVNASLQAGSTVTFTWQAQPGVNAYDFHFFNRADGSLTFTRDILPADACSASLCSLTQTLSLPVLNGHAWRVRSKTPTIISSWSRSEFSVVNGTTGGPVTPVPPTVPTPPDGPVAPGIPVVPVNISPAVNASIEQGSSVTFTWQAQPGIAAYDFHLFDRTDGNLTFTRDIFPADACTDTVCSLTQTVTLPVLTGHAWRVRAKTSSDISGWSRSTFNVVDDGTGGTVPPTPTPPVEPEPEPEPPGPIGGCPITPPNTDNNNDGFADQFVSPDATLIGSNDISCEQLNIFSNATIDNSEIARDVTVESFASVTRSIISEEAIIRGLAEVVDSGVGFSDDSGPTIIGAGSSVLGDSFVGTGSVVEDAVVISDGSFVDGSAIGGRSRIEDSRVQNFTVESGVTISNNSNISNTGRRSDSILRSGSIIADSSIFGPIEIGGNSQVIGASISGFSSIGRNFSIGRGSSIGADADILFNVSIGERVTIENNADFGVNTFIGNDSNIGPLVETGSTVFIGNSVSIDGDVVLGDGVRLNAGVTVGVSVEVGARTIVGAGATIRSGSVVRSDFTIDPNTTFPDDYPEG